MFINHILVAVIKMKIYAISDNVDTRTGLRMAGIDGAVVHTYDALKNQMDAVAADADIGILLITERLCTQFPELIADVKLSRRLPLVVEIPDRHGGGRKQGFISSYIRDAIGVKLDPV